MLLAIALAGPAAAQDLPCPAGTGPVRTALPDGLVEDACARVGGVPHGPSVIRAADGSLRAAGDWVEGARHGTWRFYGADGRTREVGDFTAGARVGTWTTLAPDGTPVATVFHDALGGAAAGQGSGDPRVRWATGAVPALDRVPDAQAGAEAEPDPLSDPALQPGAGAVSGERPGPDLRVGLWGTLALRSDAHGIRVVSLGDGAARWATRPPDGLGGEPVTSRRFLAATTGSGMVLVVDPDAGRQVRIRTEAGATHVAAVDQDTVWLRDGVGRVAAWSWQDGAVRWQSRRSYAAVAPAYAEGAVVAARGRELHALDARTGDGRWTIRLDSEVVSVQSGRDGTVLAATRSGAVERISGAEGRPLQTLVEPGAGGAEAALRDEPGGVVRRGPGAVRLLGGAEAAGFAGWPDLADGLACGGDPGGGLRCRTPGATEDRLRIPGLAPAGRVRLHGELLLVPTKDGLVAVDLPVALATSEAPTGGLPVVLLPEGGLPIDASLPFDLVERPGADPACTLTDAVLDLGAAVAALPVADDGARPAFRVEVPELQVDWTEGDPAWAFGPGWQGDLLDARWEATYTTWWRPELVAVTPFDGSASAAAALDRLLACDGPGASFRGQAIAVQAGRRVVVEGRLRLQPWPHEVDGLLGCLVDVSVDGEDLGPFRPSEQSGWIDLHIAQHGGDTEPVLPDEGAALPPSIDSGELVLETLLPGELERVELGFGTPALLSLEDAWPSGLDLVVRDEAGTERLRTPGDDLRLDAGPDHTEWWAVGTVAPVAPEAAGPSTLWSRSDCGDGEE